MVGHVRDTDWGLSPPTTGVTGVTCCWPMLLNGSLSGAGLDLKNDIGDVNILGEAAAAGETGPSLGTLGDRAAVEGPGDMMAMFPPDPPPTKLSSSAFVTDGVRVAVIPKLSATLKLAGPPNSGLLGGFFAISETKQYHR